MYATAEPFGAITETPEPSYNQEKYLKPYLVSDHALRGIPFLYGCWSFGKHKKVLGLFGNRPEVSFRDVLGKPQTLQGFRA